MITGANRGLGLGLTGAFLADGWKVIALARRRSPELGALECPELEIHVLDLVDDRGLADLADQLSDRVIDVLFNNAGRMAHRDSPRKEGGTQGFGHFDRDLWHEVFDINLFTPMALAERFAENLARSPRGRIVTMTSTLGSMASNTRGGLYAYRASKAGVNAITKSMAIDLAERNIIAVALHPGWVRTDMGGSRAPVDVETSVDGMKRVVENLRPEDSGKVLAYDGSELPW
jgi:NAD(P)-dependent dehydrogenase (short-subunit alcohol dehydrogenase family)